MSESPTWRVLIAPQAEKVLKRLPTHEQARFRVAIDRLASGPYQAPVKRLRGRPEWSLRVGDRRALLRVDHEARVIVVVGIGPRGDVYKG